MQAKRKIILLFLLLLFIFAQGSRFFQTETQVRVGVYENSPLSFIDESGTAQGFVIDTLREVARQESWELVFMPCEWETCLMQLEQGEIDLLGPIGYSDERGKRYDFSQETLLINWGQVYVQRGDADISILDLDGKKVALLSGDIHADYFDELIKSFDVTADIVFFDSYPEVLLAIERGRTYAGVVNQFFALEHADEYDVQQSAIIFNPIEVRFAATKGQHAALLEPLDADIDALKNDQDSFYGQFIDLWVNGGDETDSVLPGWVYWAGGGALLFVVSLLAITRFLQLQMRKQTLALRESRAELALIVDSIPVMVSYLDTDLRYIYADHSYAAWYGFSKEEVVGKLVKEILPPENYEKVRPNLERVVETGEEIHYENVVTRFDGEVRTVAISYIPHLDEQGKTKAFFATVRDITRQRQAESDLRESEEKYRSLVDNTLVGIYIIQQGEVCFANQGLADLFGYATPKDVQQKLVQDLIAPEDWELVRAEMSRKESGEKHISQYSFKALRQDGSVFNAEILSQAITYQGKPAIQGILTDITARVEAEERFRSLSEAASEALFISEKGLCIEQNLTAERMFGYTLEEAIGQPGTNWIAEEDRDLVMHHMLSGYEEPYRVTALRKDGSTFPCEIIGRMMEYRGHRARITSLRDISAQVSAEEELRESEERYRKMIQDNHAVMFLIDPATGDIVEANDAASEFYGWTKEELQQKKISDINTLSTDETYHEMQLAKAAKKNHFLFRHRLANREIRDVEVHSTPITAYGRELLHSIIHDVTSRVKAEKALSESEANLREVQSIARLGSYVFDIPQGVWSSNPILDEIFGIDEMFERTIAGWVELIHPDDRGMMQEYLEAHVLGDKEPFDTEYRIIHQQSGETRWVYGMGKLELDPQGNILKLVGSIQDITERVLSNQQVIESEERLRTLINATPDIICFKDGQGRWLMANDADLSLFELSDVDYVGKTDKELAEYSELHREAFLTCSTTDEVAWQAGGISRGNEVIATRDQGDKVYDVIKVPMFHADGTRRGLVVLGRDITKQVAAQAKLQKNSRHLEIVSKITQALSTSLALEDVLDIILQQVAQVIEADSVSIFLVDETGKLTIVKAVGEAKHYEGRSFALEDTLMNAMSPGEQSCMIEDVLDSPHFHSWDGTSKMRGWLGVPLNVRDLLVGYLTFDSNQPQFFSDQNVALAESFAPQVAQAIYNANLHQEIQEHLQQIETLNTVSTALSTSLELSHLLELIFEQINEVLPFDSGAIFLLEEDLMRVVMDKGIAPSVIGKTFPADEKLLSQVGETREPLILNDPQRDPRFANWGQSDRIYSWVGLPLIARDEVIGFLTLDSFQEDFVYTEEHVGLAMSFATQAAQAIYNARLYERVIADANDLEKRVQQRTAELGDFVELTADREIRMIELKEVIKKLRTQLINAGQTPVADDPLNEALGIDSDTELD